MSDAEEILTKKLIDSYRYAHSNYEKSLKELTSASSIVLVGGIGGTLFLILNLLFGSISLKFCIIALLIAMAPWLGMAIGWKFKSRKYFNLLNELCSELYSIGYTVRFDKKSPYETHLIIHKKDIHTSSEEITLTRKHNRKTILAIDEKAYREVFQLS